MNKTETTLQQKEETDPGPEENEKEGSQMQSQMLCELQRVKKEMLENSKLVSKPEV